MTRGPGGRAGVMRRLVTGAAFMLVGLLLPVTGTAHAASGYCTSDAGVTVVVDYGTLGGGVVIRCAPGANGSGLAALHAAGFSTQGTIKDGPAFVCRINGRPSAEQEKCQSTPKASANWHYYQASNGGSWAFSALGAASQHVRAGGFEGWSFTSAPPGVAPRRPGGSGSGSGGGLGHGSGGGSGGGSGPGSDSEGGSGSGGERGVSSGDDDGTVLNGGSIADDSALPKPKPRAKQSAAGSAESGEAPGAGETDAAGTNGPATTNTPQSAASEDGDSAAPWIAGGIIAALILGLAVTQWRRRVR